MVALAYASVHLRYVVKACCFLIQLSRLCSSSLRHEAFIDPSTPSVAQRVLLVFLSFCHLECFDRITATHVQQ